MEENPNVDLNRVLAERFVSLPKVVQDAINSADVQKHLRDLAQTQKLHLDQWQVLENNVMLTLMGFQPIADLAANLEKDLEVTAEQAKALADSVSQMVFAPIRHEMEQSLDHPTAVQEAETALESARTQEIATAQAQNEPAPATKATPVVPATPPPAPPTEKAVRGTVAPTYTGTASHERKSIEGDPYREPII
jgi:hypothetical protein